MKALAIAGALIALSICLDPANIRWGIFLYVAVGVTLIMLALRLYGKLILLVGDLIFGPRSRW
jgi:predicted membrane channel-forming protein YqfA (hemolysin III family)